MKLTMEDVCERALYPSLRHFQARLMTKARLATLSPTQRAARTRAQKLLSAARRRPPTTFATSDVQPPTRMNSWRDYLLRDPSHRDIIRP
jgi:hypothetical protein